jgi:hypothetical protein
MGMSMAANGGVAEMLRAAVRAGEGERSWGGEGGGGAVIEVLLGLVGALNCGGSRVLVDSWRHMRE